MRGLLHALVLTALTFTLITLAYYCFAGPGVSGRVTVIDGDTIKIEGHVVRLFGIDAPELAQSCEREGKAWSCGAAAKTFLDHLVQQQNVRCDENGTDAYSRMLGICYIGDMDLNASMVLSGFALAFRRYSDRYVIEESQARAAHAGLWSGQFVQPWAWRKIQVQSPPQPGCPIKGNMGKSGKRIYHMPGDRDYDRTKIDPKRGERWFCSEADALAAGWSRAGM
jgi:endonuclease YncB( thermonuclease family)